MGHAQKGKVEIAMGIMRIARNAERSGRPVKLGGLSHGVNRRHKQTQAAAYRLNVAEGVDAPIRGGTKPK